MPTNKYRMNNRSRLSWLYNYHINNWLLQETLMDSITTEWSRVVNTISSIFPTDYINYKEEKVTLQWGNLAGITLTKWRDTATMRGHTDTLTHLMWCTEKNTYNIIYATFLPTMFVLNLFKRKQTKWREILQDNSHDSSKASLLKETIKTALG